MKRFVFSMLIITGLLTVLNCGGGGGGGGGGSTPATVPVSGTVLDSRNNAVPFATVTITSTPVITTTDMSGAFQADVEEGDHRVSAVKSGVSFLDTAFTASSGGGNLGILGPTAPAGYWPWYEDSDSDDYGNAASVIDTQVSQAPAYTIDFTDCDDTEVAVNPGASEVCNGIDDDCGGGIDDGLVTSTYYADTDGDAYGDAGASRAACAQPTDYVLDNTDCDDTDAAVNPGATEVCNGIDDDCGGGIDDGLSFATYYRDADNDTYGTTSLTENTCLGAPSVGYVADSTDCDDAVAAVNPAAEDICDGIDNNCDQSIDEEFSAGGTVTFTDLAGNSGLVLGDSCGSGECSSGSVVCSGNQLTLVCDTESQAAPETCDGLDNDCDGTVDDGLTLDTFYADADGDTYGNAAVAASACTAPTGYVSDNTDCDDSLATVNPGAAEVCNGIDDDCVSGADNGLPTSIRYRDFDEDGYGNPGSSLDLCGPINGYVDDNTDCADNDVTRFPGAPEVCDGKDNDCDGPVDEDPPTLYADADGDGFGSAGAITVACTATGYVALPGDCDDGDASFNPFAGEICGDGLDQDCSGADISCPSYPFTASTTGPVAQGDWWSYAVTGDDTGTLTKYISIGTQTSPESGEDCVSLVNTFDLTMITGSSLTYLAQDADGKLRVCGFQDSVEGPDWIAATDGGSYTLYPSPLTAGQAGSTSFSFDTSGASGAYTFTVDSIESIQTPAGIFSTYKIFTTYYEFWPGLTAAEDEEYFEFNVSWFSPDYGEVMFDTQFVDFIGTSATPEYDIYLSEALTDSSDLGSECGGTGPGTGQPASLAGTWVGTGNDHFISAGVNYFDYEVSVSLDGSGNVTGVALNSTDAGVTGIVTAVDDNFYTIEFDDVSTGQLLVDGTFTYMVFIRNTGFAANTDMFFSVLQKGAAGAAAVYPKYSSVGLFSGFGYDYCAQTDEFYRFEPAALIPGPEGGLGMPVKGIGPSGSFDANLLLWQPQFGWWNGFDTAGGDLHLFLSPDGLFAGAYHQVRGILYIWPEDFAFYALSR